ncbi:MAG TPA: hypothetical protein VF414_16560, partial [Thermoanaerobaculia bacterium]
AAKTNEKTDERIILASFNQGSSQGERPVNKKVLAGWISEPLARKKEGSLKGSPVMTRAAACMKQPRKGATG